MIVLKKRTLPPNAAHPATMASDGAVPPRPARTPAPMPARAPSKRIVAVRRLSSGPPDVESGVDPPSAPGSGCCDVTVPSFSTSCCASFGPYAEECRRVKWQLLTLVRHGACQKRILASCVRFGWGLGLPEGGQAVAERAAVRLLGSSLRGPATTSSGGHMGQVDWCAADAHRAQGGPQLATEACWGNVPQ